MSANMQGNRHPNKTFAAVWRASSICTKHKSQGLALVCALIGVVVGAAAAIWTTIYMKNPLQKDEQVSPFCCPGLARELHWYRNVSISPCRDFFSHICSNVIHDRLRDEKDLITQLEHSFMTGAMLQGDAGRFLTSFYRSCVKTLPQPRSAFYSLAKALVHDLWEPHGPVDTRKAIIYIFAASIKYRMSSAISVSIEKDKSLFMKSLAKCDRGAYIYDIMTAVVDALNERADSTTVSSAAAFGFRSKLCEDIISYPQKRKLYSVVKDKNNIQEEVWNVADLEAGLDAYGSSLLTAKFVTAMGVHRIHLIHDQFAMEEENSTAGALKVAFLVWNSVARELQGFYKVDNSEQVVFRHCKTESLMMRAVWDTFGVEMLTSPEKDAAAQEVFNAVKRSVYTDIRASLLIDANDTERLHNFFENLELVPPVQASNASIPVPNGSEHYGENRLRGYLYEFFVSSHYEATLADVVKVRYEDVRFMGEGQLFLSSGIYGDIDRNSSEYGVPNNARLGRLLAEALWYMTLAKMKWTPKSQANINRFRKCFIDNYLGEDRKRVKDGVFYSVLGLSSAVKVVSKSDWQKLKPAWSLWHISNAQFFFMLSTYYKCRQYFWKKDAREINVSLLYTEDFAIAFKCPFSAPMEKTRECFANGSLELKQGKTH